ncbi:REJ domain-containing protein [Powellomyces hirtus]|nr:REJ domain-containing protein [Powellomyces hirtus]
MRLFDLPGVAAVGLLGLARWTAAQATGDFDIAGPTVASTCAPISLSGSKNLPAAAASSSANAQYKWSIDKSSAVNLTEAGLAALAAGNYGGGIITIPGDAKVGSGNMVVNLRVTYNVTTYPAVATATPSSSATGVVGSSTTVAGGQASITPAPAASSSSTSAGVESGSASSDSLSSGSTVSGNTASTDSTASAGSAPSTQSGTASDAATSSSYSTSSNDGSTASSGSSSTADPGATTASAGTTSSSNVASSGSSTSASEASSATAGLTTSSTAEGSASSTAAAGATSSTSAAESTTSSPAAAGTTSSSSAAELTTSTASSAGIASSITTTNAEPTTSSSAAVSSTSASSIAQPTTSATSSAEASSSSSTAQSTAASTSATSSAEASSFSSTTQSTAASTSATSSAEASSSSSTAQSTAASTSAPSSAEASSSSSTAQSTAASTSATSSAEASSSSSTAQSTAASTSATSSAEASSSSSTAQSTAASTSATSSAEAISSSSTAQSTAASTSSAEITSSSSTAESTTSSASATSSIEITSSSSTAESTTSSASDTSSIETSSSTSAAASTSTEASTSSDASPSTESSVSTITSSDASSSTESSSSTTTFETTTVATTTETTVTTATETTTTGTTETTTTAAPTGLALRRRAEAFKEYVRQRADEKKRNLFRRALVERADPIVNTYTLNAQYTLVISASAPPTVSVSGPETVFVGLGNPLSLTASGVYVTCNSADSAALKYLWTTNATGGFGANSVTTTSKLYVPEGLQADASGSSVTVTVTTVDGKTATKSISVLPIPRAFVANLAGGATRSTGANIPLRLDASASRDNAYPKAVLTYSWTCTSTGACPAAFASNTANFINIPENTLSAGVYNFTVTVGSSGASQTASASTIVDVAANVAIACTAEYDSSNVAANSIISDNVIGIRATCVGDVDTANYRWSSLPGNLVTNTDKVLFGGETNSYVYFKANALAPGSYNFSLVVTVPGSSAQAQAYTIINVLAPPSGGSLTLAQGANPGTAYTTEYKFSAGGWKASTDGDTLRYAYSYTYLSGGRTVESGLSIRSTESEGTFKIPHEGTVNIVVRVFDSKGATTTYAYPTPLVLQPISSAALGEAISASANAIRNAIASGDSQALISASINSAALVSKSNEGGYSSPEAVAAAAQAQAVVVNAMVDLAVNAKDSDTANSCAKALLSNDLSIMDHCAKCSIGSRWYLGSKHHRGHHSRLRSLGHWRWRLDCQHHEQIVPCPDFRSF